MNLRVHANGQIRISAPHASSRYSIECFLQEKKEWIKKQQSRLQNRSSPLELQYKTGEQHYFSGELYTLIIHEGSEKKGIFTENQSIHCHLPVNASRDLTRAMLYAWYHDQMQAIVPGLIEKWRTIIPVPSVTYRLKIMKSLWGSCHPQKKVISLNLHLMKKPLICLEYVIVHELVHLLETGHNRRFYRFMDKFMPEWRTCKALLV